MEREEKNAASGIEGKLGRGGGVTGDKECMEDMGITMRGTVVDAKARDELKDVVHGCCARALGEVWERGGPWKACLL